MPASEFIGREVVSRSGRPLGEVRDVVIDVINAQVRYAVVAVNGWLGFNDELYAVPLDALAAEPGSRRVVLGIAARRLLDSAPLEPDAWPDDDYWRGIHPALSREERPPLRQFVRATELFGREVTDRTGEHAGEIEDAVLDLANGNVLYFAFDYDEAVLPDRPALRLAPQVFSFPLDGGPPVVNVGRERLATP